MTTSNIKACIPCDVHQVWEVVTEVAHYAWRSDLSKTEILGSKQFIEYTKEGYPTTFTITITEPYKRWELDMENSNMKGHWIGIFTSKGNETGASIKIGPGKMGKDILNKTGKRGILDIVTGCPG